MADPKKVSQEEYDELRSKLEEKYNYDDMSDEEKERFDSTMDQVAVVDDKNDETGDEDDIEMPEPGHDGIPPREQNDDDEYVR